jgi:hypothetical protein
MIELSIDSIIVKTYVRMEAGSIINGNHIQNVGFITFNVCLYTVQVQNSIKI